MSRLGFLNTITLHSMRASLALNYNHEISKALFRHVRLVYNHVFSPKEFNQSTSQDFSLELPVAPTTLPYIGIFPMRIVRVIRYARASTAHWFAFKLEVKFCTQSTTGKPSFSYCVLFSFYDFSLVSPFRILKLSFLHAIFKLRKDIYPK